MLKDAQRPSACEQVNYAIRDSARQQSELFQVLRNWSRLASARLGTVQHGSAGRGKVSPSCFESGFVMAKQSRELHAEMAKVWRGVPLGMRRINPECLDSERSDRSSPADILLREEPEDEEEEDEDEEEHEGDEEDDDGDEGYSE
jgi:hypothetical protein